MAGAASLGDTDQCKAKLVIDYNFFGAHGLTAFDFELGERRFAIHRNHPDRFLIPSPPGLPDDLDATGLNPLTTRPKPWFQE